jgi:hypothetical protein
MPRVRVSRTWIGLVVLLSPALLACSQDATTPPPSGGQRAGASGTADEGTGGTAGVGTAGGAGGGNTAEVGRTTSGTTPTVEATR